MRTLKRYDKTLVMLSGGKACVKHGRVYSSRFYGIVIELIAARFKDIVLCMSEDLNGNSSDWNLPDNVRFVPHPTATTALAGIKMAKEISSIYDHVIRQGDLVFVRGNLTPGISSIYRSCAKYDKPTCHWLVGNPMALLKSHKRYGFMKDTMGKCFTAWWDYQLMRGRARTGGALLCNGQEIADRFASPNTHVTVSSTVREADFFMREDTCQSERVRLTCVGFVRPEKGVEYLFEALGQLKTRRPVELVMVGSRDRYPAYQAKLDGVLRKHGISGRVTWAGHAGPERLKEHLQESDLFVLPTLSEGTPRVLVEARAYGVPVVSTNVGGIPTSVHDGYDGLLVAPKDSKALAAAIDRVIEDPELRRHLIENGYTSARELTVDKFVDQILDIYRSMGAL